MVTGSILNGTRTPAGWASYFLDHSTALPGRPSARLAGPPAHCSYVREFLLEAGGFPEDMRAGEDTVVNRELHRRGHPAYREQDLHLVHRSRCETPGRLIAHHFRRGRAMGRILCDDHRDGHRLLRSAVLRSFLLAYVTRRMRRTDRNVARWGGELRSRYRRVRPLVLAGSVAAWAGIWREVLRPVPGRLRTLFRSG